MKTIDTYISEKLKINKDTGFSGISVNEKPEIDSKYVDIVLNAINPDKNFWRSDVKDLLTDFLAERQPRFINDLIILADMTQVRYDPYMRQLTKTNKKLYNRMIKKIDPTLSYKKYDWYVLEDCIICMETDSREIYVISVWK